MSSPRQRGYTQANGESSSDAVSCKVCKPLCDVREAACSSGRADAGSDPCGHETFNGKGPKMGKKRRSTTPARERLRPLTWTELAALVACVVLLAAIYMVGGAAAVAVVAAAAPALYAAFRRGR